jgi:hypothetical protein
MILFMMSKTDGITWINNRCSIDLSKKQMTGCLDSVAGLAPDNAIEAI